MHCPPQTTSSPRLEDCEQQPKKQKRDTEVNKKLWMKVNTFGKERSQVTEPTTHKAPANLSERFARLLNAEEISKSKESLQKSTSSKSDCHSVFRAYSYMKICQETERHAMHTRTVHNIKVHAIYQNWECRAFFECWKTDLLIVWLFHCINTENWEQRDKKVKENIYLWRHVYLFKYLDAAQCAFTQVKHCGLLQLTPKRREFSTILFGHPKFSPLINWHGNHGNLVTAGSNSFELGTPNKLNLLSLPPNMHVYCMIWLCLTTDRKQKWHCRAKQDLAELVYGTSRDMSFLIKVCYVTFWFGDFNGRWRWSGRSWRTVVILNHCTDTADSFLNLIERDGERERPAGRERERERERKEKATKGKTWIFKGYCWK